MIDICHLTKTFHRKAALLDINLSLNKAECIALIGPNASGKTTLMKCLLGMVIPSQGKILFRKKNIRNQWLYRNELGYMPQIGQYPEHLTIAQVINLMISIRNIPINQLNMELYEAYKLSSISHKTMRTLSGGTRQKLSASLAFMFNPNILILDEPTAGLDPLAIEILKEKLNAERKKEKLVLVSSHSWGDFDNLISQIVYLQEGKLLFHKNIAELQKETNTHNLSQAVVKLMRTTQTQLTDE